MFRRFLISLVVGILVFLVIFFGLPLIVSEAEIVAWFNSLLLDWSNRYFATMPSLLVTYLAQSNLVLIAVTAGVLVTLAAMLLATAWRLIWDFIGWLIGLLRREKTEAEREDLAPIDMKATFVSSGDGKQVLGRGMDRVDRD